jgi:hypothetical protein
VLLLLLLNTRAHVRVGGGDMHHHRHALPSTPTTQQVFSDYQKFLSAHGPGVRYLPTPAFYYGLDVGPSFVRAVCSDQRVICIIMVP